MLRPNLIRTGYVLGVSLLLASIIYFFAANWPELQRLQKVALAAALVALFYGAAFGLSRLRALGGHRWFVGNLLLAAGCVAFGVAVMLIGQVYNSHADNYKLFLVWTAPALLFALVCRYTPFYVMTFILGHLTLWFYFYPTMLYYEYSNAQQAAICGLFAVLNALILAFAEAGRLKSETIRWMAYLVFHSAIWMLANSFVLDDIGLWMNLVAAAVLAGCFYYYGKIRTNRLYLTLTALALSAFAVLKFLELADAFASSLFFFYGLLFVALLLTGNVLFFRHLQKITPPHDGDRGRSREEPAPEEAETRREDAEQRERGEESGGIRPGRQSDRAGLLAGRIVSTIVTVIGILIGTISLVGMVFMLSDLEDPEHILFMLALLFVLPMLFLPRINPVVRHTVITIGYLGGLASLLSIDKPAITFLFVLAVIAGWIRLPGRTQRLFTYTLINANLLMALGQLMEGRNWTFIVLAMAVLNGAVYGLQLLLERRNAELGSAAWSGARSAALAFTLIFLFWLTFRPSIFPYAHEIFNALNFVIVTLLVCVAIRRQRHAEAWIGLVFWFAYITYKYYDLLWPLLHKSLTLAIVGVIVLAVTYGFSRSERDGQEAQDLPFLQRKWLPILLIIALQFGWISFQTARSEYLLASGVIVKLELAPFDPRSLLQGDYVRLNYTISRPPEDVRDELREKGRSRVRVALVPGEDGLYRFGRVLAEGEEPRPGEVAVNGVFDGWWSVHYGIETYFIPEGTGADVENKARYAYIRVGAGGDAIIERLAEH